MSDFTVIEDGTQQYFTGLHVPDERPQVFTRYAESSFPLLAWDVIKDLATSDSRRMGRKRFGSAWIKNQGSRGSCNGYAGAKATERARVLRGADHTELSGEDLYAQINGGRDNGSGLQNGMNALVRSGVAPEAMVPHQEFRESRISSEAKAARSRFKLLEPLGVDTWQELCSGLAIGFVGVVAVHASNAWSRLDGNGVCGRSQGAGNHSVCVDDIVYIGDDPFVDMANSWGTGWGVGGRGYLNWDLHLSRPNQYHDFYLLPTTIDDPNEEQAPLPPGDDSEPTPAPPSSDVLIEMETSPGCHWCSKWKNEEQPKAIAAGWEIQTKSPSGPVPKFTIRIGGMSHEFARGFQSFETLKRVIESM